MVISGSFGLSDWLHLTSTTEMYIYPRCQSTSSREKQDDSGGISAEDLFREKTSFHAIVPYKGGSTMRGIL